MDLNIFGEFVDGRTNLTSTLPDCNHPDLHNISGAWVERNLVKTENCSQEHLENLMAELEVGFKDISWTY